MALITSPAYNPASAYRPIVWQVMYTSDLANPITNCRFSITIGSTVIVGRVAPYQVVASLTPTFYEYYFYVDVQQYLQRYLTTRTRRSTFGNLNADTRVENTDSFIDFTVDFEYEFRNSIDGKIDTYPSIDSSGTQYACIATRQNGEDMSLDEFLGVPYVTPLKRFLTNSPKSRIISTTENLFLSFLGQWNFLEVVTYDSSGLELSRTYPRTLYLAPNEMNTFGVGKIQLDAIPVAQYFGSVPPDWAGAAYYTVQGGLGILFLGGISFVANSELFTYTFDVECNKHIRLYWTNALGGVDNYDFPYQELAIGVTSDLFQKPLNWPHTQDDYGRARTNIQASKAYSCTKLLTNTDMAWLKELFYSVEVYVVNPDDSSEYWRCWLSDTDVIERKKVGLFEISFTLNFSQDIVTHRI
jgi:hypothetical protein